MKIIWEQKLEGETWKEGKGGMKEWKAEWKGSWEGKKGGRIGVQVDKEVPKSHTLEKLSQDSS